MTPQPKNFFDYMDHKEFTQFTKWVKKENNRRGLEATALNCLSVDQYSYQQYKQSK